MTTSPFRLSIRSLTLSSLIHLGVVFGLTFLFCWGVGAYTLRKATDALQGIGFVYLLLGLSIWGGRGLRFYNQSAHFTTLMKVSEHDRPDLPPNRRGLLLLIFENQPLLTWVLVGLAALCISILFGSILKAQFSPDTVLNFLVRQDLNPLLKPGGFYKPY